MTNKEIYTKIYSQGYLDASRGLSGISERRFEEQKLEFISKDELRDVIEKLSHSREDDNWEKGFSSALRVIKKHFDL